MRHERIDRDARIGDLYAATSLFAPALAGLDHEELCIAHLDGDLRLLKLTATRGSDDRSVDMPIRVLLHDALALGSRALLIAHNHPGGDATPSRADKAATRRLVDLTRPLDIRLIDHLIFAGNGCISFREMGLL